MRCEFSELKGKTLATINRDGDYELHFRTSDGDDYYMWHSQDCCETVEIEEVIGNLDDLIGSPIVEAEEVSGDLPAKDKWDEDYKWTFYKIGTQKGFVTIRWYGSSNGYYSIDVDFTKGKRSCW